MLALLMIRSEMDAAFREAPSRAPSRRKSPEFLSDSGVRVRIYRSAPACLYHQTTLRTSQSSNDVRIRVAVIANVANTRTRTS
uniref:Uncharacterized protein n=1 Tax=Oryza meridionalis TaxID=40149 RepID=A0A0E0DXB8_9ORYZ